MAGTFLPMTAQSGAGRNRPAKRGTSTYAELKDEFAQVLGEAAARTLLSTFAGCRLYVPRHPEVDHEISRAIGWESAKLFCEYFHGVNILFPTSAERDLRVIDLHKAGKSSREIVSSLLVSERYVRKVLSDYRGSGLPFQNKAGRK